MRAHQLIVIAALALAAPRAHADQASTLRQQGLKAAQDKNWDVARERFEQSYALEPRPLTLFNLAVAQEHTGKLVAARESYAAFLEQVAPGENETFRKLARDAIPTLDEAIPTLRIRATGLAAGDAIEVDGQAASTAAAIALDPGSHTVAVRRGGEAIAQRATRSSSRYRPPFPWCRRASSRARSHRRGSRSRSKRRRSANRRACCALAGSGVSRPPSSSSGLARPTSI
jgi:hypothetical protein